MAGKLSGRMNEQTTIILSDRGDRWRFRCPQGHANWEPTNHHFWCQTCAGAAEHGVDVEPEFAELHDLRSGELVERERIELRLEGSA